MEKKLICIYRRLLDINPDFKKNERSEWIQWSYTALAIVIRRYTEISEISPAIFSTVLSSFFDIPLFSAKFLTILFPDARNDISKKTFINITLPYILRVKQQALPIWDNQFGAAALRIFFDFACRQAVPLFSRDWPDYLSVCKNTNERATTVCAARISPQPVLTSIKIVNGNIFSSVFYRSLY